MALYIKCLACLSFVFPVVHSQSSSTTLGDGVSSAVTSSSVRFNTVLNDGKTTTYRAIPTLPASIDNTPPVLPNVYDPQAVKAQSVCPGYTASNVKNTQYGFTATLSLAGTACNVYGTDVETLNFSIVYQSAARLAVRITPAYLDATNITQYVIPSYYLHEPTIDADVDTTEQSNDLLFTWSNEPSFGFAVIRKSNGDILYNTKGTRLVFEDQFVEWISSLPENYNLYGLGERLHNIRLGNYLNATTYPADAGNPIDFNLYGTHPFYLDTRYYEIDAATGGMTLVTSNETKSTGNYVSYSHGVYLRNTHGQEVLLRPTSITWRTLGGSIELYFFSGPDQPSVTKQYQAGVIGYPAMQQYFAFGYHQCRWGYSNWTVMQDVVDNFRKFDIPLETVWNDIDIYNQYRDFENDQNTFSYAQAATFLSGLHAAGQHYIPIVDSSIYIPNPLNASDAYATYERGNASNAFLRNPDGSQYIGDVWPGYAVFPDWRSEGTGPWWTSELLRWHQNIDFDGIWIDLSEASSFCVGSCGSGHVTENPVHPPFSLPGEPGNVDYSYPEDFNITNTTEAAAISSASAAQAASIAATAVSLPSTSTSYLRTTPTPGVRNENFPPYVINNINGALPVHAVAPNATHHDGTAEYDIHSLFGHEILNATYNALTAVFPGKRPLIIGRSTFAGSGKWAGHWGGDNNSLFKYMYFSIPQALSFSLFGIPMFGVDTCGFSGNTDEQLCNRWMQLSAFFPFYRNHNVFAAISQEPYQWASVIEATKTAMSIRYSLLPYMYTLFYLAHTTGSTVMRALAWEFPNDPSLAAADRQFLLGPSIMVTPVLEPLATTVDGVFPGVGRGTVWYDWYNQTAVDVAPGANVTIDAPLGHIPVYVRGGSVLPMQQPGYTTTESRKNPWSLLVALDMQGAATGQLYVDDGESQTPNATLLVDFVATGETLYASVRGQFVDTNALANITILGVSRAPLPGKVTLNGSPLKDVSYSKAIEVLTITGLQTLTSMGAWSADWTLFWN